MLYKRPFAAALEEAIEGTEEIVSEPLTETELEANAEETAELNAEIQQDSNDVEATLEEVDALEEQAAATDEVLAATADEETAGEPVADEASVITEEQVVTAEESYKWTLARLGGAGKYQEVVRIAGEAKAAGKTRRERLKVCNEGVKETIARLIQSIINMAKQIASRITVFVKTQLAKYFNYKEKIKENKKIIEKLDSANVDAKELATTLASVPSVEIAGVLATSDVSKILADIPTKKEQGTKLAEVTVKKLASLIANTKAIDNDAEDKGLKSVETDKITKTNTDEFKTFRANAASNLDKALENGKLFGLSANAVKDLSGFEVLTATGKMALGIRDNGTSLEKVSLEFASDFGESANLNVGTLITSVKGAANDFSNASAKMKQISDAVYKVQKEVESNLKKIESTLKIEGFGKAKAIRAIKAAGIDLSMALFNSYLNSIKTYVRVSDALAAYGDGGKKSKKKESK